MCCLCCCAEGEDSDKDSVDVRSVRRGCTDTWALILFLSFTVGLGVLTFVGWANGDPYRIYYGTDSFGNTCGRNNAQLFLADAPNETFVRSGQDMTNRKKLFPLDITRPLSSIWLCVPSCPPAVPTSQVLAELSRTENISLCIDKEISELADSGTVDGLCPDLPLRESVPILNRCVPNDVLQFGKEMVANLLGSIKELDGVRAAINDIVDTSPYIARVLVAAFGLSLFMIILLRFVAPIAVYFVYALVVTVFAGISFLLWYAWWSMHGEQRLDTAMGRNITVESIDDVERALEEVWRDVSVSEWTLLGMAVAASLMTALVLLLTWCLLPKGALLVKLFRQAGAVLASMPWLLVQPVVTVMAVLLISGYTLFSALLVYTSVQMAKVQHNATGVDIVEYRLSPEQKWMLFYQFVGFIWLIEFVMAYQRMLIAGSVSQWYFDRSNRSPVCTARWNTIRYHLGSLAVGSFIITLLRVPRYILMYLYNKMRGTENVVVRYALACCICCLQCVEKCMRYINNNAYTVIAYSGKSFCPAAKTAVNILLDNAANVATINTVGDFVLFLGKLVVAVCSSLVLFFTIKDIRSVSYPWLPCLLVFVLSYQIANCFLSLYEMVIDALFLCIAEDDLMIKDGQSSYRNEEMLSFMHTTVESEREMNGGSSRRMPIEMRRY